MEKKAQEREKKKISRRDFIVTSGAVAAGVAGSAILYKEPSQPDLDLEIPPLFRFTSHKVDNILPLNEKDFWNNIDGVNADLAPQKATAPIMESFGVDQIMVKSVHDKDQIAFYLQWNSKVKNSLESMDKFRDAVAVQFTTSNGLPIGACMGSQEYPVHILQWKASWQTDIEFGFQGVKAAFPNLYYGVVPENILDTKVADLYYVGREAGNSLSKVDKKSSIEELKAVGFGTIEPFVKQSSTGQAAFLDKEWSVLITQHMKGNEKGKVSFNAGQVVPIAIAVWDGLDRNVGGRKSYSQWGELNVE